jgi:hypothetical protein
MFSFWSRPKAARRPSTPLRLETLEDRCTPSVTPVLPRYGGFDPGDYHVSETAGSVPITVILDRAPSVDYSVWVRVVGDSATAFEDYPDVQYVVTVPAGQTRATFDFRVIADGISEPDESVWLELPEFGVDGLPTPRGMVTISDNDPAPSPGVIGIGFGPHPGVVDETAASVTLTLTRSAGSDGEVSVRVRSTGGSATPGSDYTAIDQVVTFADGQTSATLTVPLLDDLRFEGNETVTLELSDPTGGASIGNASTATLTITDNDPAVGDVTEAVQVTRGAFRRLRPGRFQQEVTLTNISDQTIVGPLRLELDRLEGGKWKLVKNVQAVPVSPVMLAPNQSISFLLVFASKRARNILYSPTVMVG